MNKPNPETLQALRIRIAEWCGVAQLFVLKKRELYWRPNGSGYTDRIEEAGRYTKEDADDRVYPYDVPVTAHPAPIPDYCESLDAIHGAEIALKDRLGDYVNAVHEIATEPGDMGWGQLTSEAWIRAVAMDRCLSKEPLV